jgi:hypothetical protein
VQPRDVLSSISLYHTSLRNMPNNAFIRKASQSVNSSRVPSLPSIFHLGPLDQLGSHTSSTAVVYVYESCSPHLLQPIHFDKLVRSLQYLLDSHPHRLRRHACGSRVPSDIVVLLRSPRRTATAMLIRTSRRWKRFAGPFRFELPGCMRRSATLDPTYEIRVWFGCAWVPYIARGRRRSCLFSSV